MQTFEAEPLAVAPEEAPSDVLNEEEWARVDGLKERLRKFNDAGAGETLARYRGAETVLGRSQGEAKDKELAKLHLAEIREKIRIFGEDESGEGRIDEAETNKWLEFLSDHSRNMMLAGEESPLTEKELGQLKKIHDQYVERGNYEQAIKIAATLNMADKGVKYSAEQQVTLTREARGVAGAADAALAGYPQKFQPAGMERARDRIKKQASAGDKLLLASWLTIATATDIRRENGRIHVVPDESLWSSEQNL